MHHNVTQIHQYPVATACAFYMINPNTLLFRVNDDRIGQRFQVSVGRARRQNHEVCDIGALAHINDT